MTGGSQERKGRLCGLETVLLTASRVGGSKIENVRIGI